MRLTTSGLLLVSLWATIATAAEDSVPTAVDLARLFHGGDLAAAREAAELLLAHTDTAAPDTLVLAARIFMANGERAAARPLLLQCADMAPDDYRPHFLLGVLRTRSCGGKQAVARLRRAIRLAPEHAPSYLWLARTAIPHDQRIAALEKVLILAKPDSVEAQQAQVLLAQHQKPKGPSQ
jgi:Tfp pilus assembly protein PilF